MAAKGWGKSKVTREALIPYVAAGIIPEFKRERWRVPAANEVEPLPRPGEFVLFLSFLDRGLALPSSDFFRQLLSFYNIKVSDLGPHSVQQIALFVALCECYLGCPPYVHNDCTRSSATEWDEAEYRKALAKVTTAVFTSFDDGLQPFSEDKPAPKRWQTIADHLPPLAGKEPPKMTEGEDDEVEDEGDRTESDSEAREYIRLPRGAKRGAASDTRIINKVAWNIRNYRYVGDVSASGGEAPGGRRRRGVDFPSGRKEPAKKEGEPRPKRLRQTILEGATDLRRPLKDALDAGARVGPGVKAIPTVKSKRKVLTRPAPVAGAAATKAAEARKAAELKKAAEAKRASAEPADLSSAREETVAESQAADATASPVKPVDGSYPLPSVGRAEGVTADVTPDEARDPIVVPSSTEGEPSAATGSGSPAPMKERRTKAARDPARPSDPAAPTGGAPTVGHGTSSLRAAARPYSPVRRQVATGRMIATGGFFHIQLPSLWRDLQPACHSFQAMSNISLPSDTDSEGKPPGWRHWWDRVATPSSSSSPPTDGDEEEEGDAVAEDGQDAEEEKEEDEVARWTQLEAEEAAEEAAVTKKEARVRARAEAHHPFADNDEDPNDHLSEGYSISSDASNASTSSQEVTNMKRLREDDELGPSKKK
ncbi:hypothetical protein QYE76_071426 [Lolium multiflorum]|uniref:Transposase (putative) gypsy type domain-containing protein n=1 Tax=Lolium multiflorum TaxID=4521 RepID=A0AAD8SLK3_LOLMU|nr:hypothetical protein QYE76_071426 [Lolium multiflorum]